MPASEARLTSGSRGAGLLWACAAVLALWLAAALLALPTPPGTPVVLPADDRTAASTGESAAAGAVQPATSVREIARSPLYLDADVDRALQARWQHSSLRGSAVDGELSFDAQGRLRWTPDLLRRFEYYLGLLGEFSEDALLRLAVLHTEQAHGSSTAAEFLAAFQHYLGYRRAAAALDGLQAPLDRLARLQALRRQWFGADAETLFGEDEAHDQRALARLATGVDEASEAALTLLPPAERAALIEARSGVLAEEQSQQFERLGIDAAQREAEREALWGAEAAARLQALDASRAEWEQRLRDYAQRRQRLLTEPGLSSQQRTQALDALLSGSFSDSERRRVLSLQDVGLLPTP